MVIVGITPRLLLHIKCGHFTPEPIASDAQLVEYLPVLLCCHLKISLPLQSLSLQSRDINLAQVESLRVLSRYALMLLFGLRQDGVPTEVVSDRDPRISGHFIQTLCAIMGTKVRISTAFHPQTDGQTERMNRMAHPNGQPACVVYSS